MNARRAISLLTLLAFLPLATGCATQKTAAPATDPVIPDELTPDEALLRHTQVRIEGYTTQSNGFHEWAGFVQAAAPDSLEFFEKVKSANAPTIAGSSFRILRADVLSLRLPAPDRGAALTTALVGTAVFVGFLAFLVAGAGQESYGGR